ncbi:MAG TPA: ATP-binding protein [Deferrimonas sp.]
MKLTIDKKVGLFISTLIFTLGATLGFYFVRTQTRAMNYELNERAAEIVADASSHLEYPVLVRDREAITRAVKGILTQKDVVFCRVEGEDGQVLSLGGEDREGPIREFAGPLTTKTLGEAEALVLDAPREAVEEIGRITLTFSLAGLNRKIFEMTRAITLAVIAAIILASLGSNLLLRRLIGRPVEQLVRATERIAGGDLAHQVALTTRDEFEMLGDSFDKMTASLRAAQEELVRREKLAILGQLAGGVGNELRNPLGVMNNAVFFLRDQLPDPGETVREYLDIIKNEIDSCQRILTDFIDFFRTRPPRMKLVPAGELIARSIERSVIPENVAVAVDLPETLPSLRVDPLQMGQVLVNFILNAIQAMPQGGALNIAARRAHSSKLVAHGEAGKTKELSAKSQERGGDFVEISAADSGEGIAPENLEKLFQPLFTTRSRGVGLGLPISRNLVEANGGWIAVESELGKGTTFTVALPVARDED